MATNRGSEAVGYKKPPRRTRFKKGVSGNPKGRPKKTAGFANALKREVRRSISVVEKGKKKRITIEEALAKRLTQKALEGDSKALSMLISIELDKKGAAQDPFKVEFNVFRTKERIPPKPRTALE